MNAVEIEEAVSALMAAPFNRAEFPYQFLAAFGFKETTVRKLKTGASNASDVPGAVLLRNNIHLATAELGKTAEALATLKASPKTAKGKVKFVLTTDGETVEAEELATDGPLAPVPMPSLPLILGSSCRWPASRPSPRSKTTRSTSKRRVGSTSSTSSS